MKVLDFGLAKAIETAAAPSAQAMNSPTRSAHATEAGIILGTAAYMSPEQAAGSSSDFLSKSTGRHPADSRQQFVQNDTGTLPTLHSLCDPVADVPKLSVLYRDPSCTLAALTATEDPDQAL